MRKLTLTLVAIALLTTTALIAQPGQHRPGGEFPGRQFRIVRALDLTEQQQEQWRTLREENRESLQPLSAELRYLHEQIQAELESESPNPTAIGELSIKAHALQSEIRTSHELLELALLDILSPEQRQAYAELQASEDLRPPRSRRGSRS